MQVFGRELTTDEIIRFVRDFAAQTRRHKDCHDCLYIDMALELADEVERLNRRAAPENKPLTLDELRGMDGEPVWVKNNAHPEYSEWKICNGAGESHYYFSNGAAYELNHYGKTWLAYARRPGGSEING